jgi:antitoxin ParD1/3/4
MPTRNVVITERQADLIEKLVTDGRYQNASEVMRRGLKLIEEEELSRSAKLEALRLAADVGWMDVEAGRVETFDDVAALRARIAEVGRRARGE